MNGSDDSDEPPTPPSAPRAPRTPRAPSAPSERWFNWNGGDFDLPNGRGMAILGNLGRGRLGVQIQDLNEGLGDALGVPDGKGVLVTDVVKDTPASRAGIRGGDVIVRVDDKTVEDTNDLRSALRDKECGGARGARSRPSWSRCGTSGATWSASPTSAPACSATAATRT
ncbi:MAG: PDZ domain-containing protein [Candidatus Eisenbacteria bacterium]|uniref:PDZ domain-containing protein n=1 Tax=Eiseniibacteriota bacterium TaxID=2212470 RepID=A0A538U156_UNCEI|nr:MAG: PDZ domain-containing protein [Candidatus Eisenbacteria bacterium]